jgi:hypothetical protein
VRGRFEKIDDLLRGAGLAELGNIRVTLLW